ncbi:MAG: hypothetical protein WBE77_01190 [Candidatus Cybelea sp.]
MRTSITIGTQLAAILQTHKAKQAGGSGGSSYVEPTAIKHRMWTGWTKAQGDGRVIFGWN